MGQRKEVHGMEFLVQGWGLPCHRWDWINDEVRLVLLLSRLSLLSFPTSRACSMPRLLVAHAPLGIPEIPRCRWI